MFIDLLGFGVLIPLVPFYAAKLGLAPSWITLVIALHALFQFVGAPLLGRASDRFGRRPVLLASMLGHAGAYLLLGFSDSIAMLVLSRVLSGLTSGNLATAYAYVADVCPPADRARGLARVSSAFALGYALGPLLGGLVTGDVAPLDAALHVPAFMAAGLSLLSAVAIWAWLPESHHPARDIGGHGIEPPSRWQIVRADRALQWMLGLALLVFVCAAMRESLLALWSHDEHGFDTRAITLLYTVNGLGVAAMQFFVTGLMIVKFGEMAALRAGIAAYGLGWLVLVVASDFGGLMIGILLGAIGTALFGTALQTLVSTRATGQTRGTVMGLYQGSASLARFGGAAFSGSIYDHIGHDAPYLLGAVVMLPALAMTLSIRNALRRKPPTDQPSPH